MGKRLWLIPILLWPLIRAEAQDIDSVPSAQKRNLSTIADEITDPSERAAFLELFRPASPAEMRARAEAFLARFPQSAFLAQAYEVAARGSFDLADFGRGLRYAHKSLTLLPENPLLLVPVADVEAREGQNWAAMAHAQDALSALERFAAPSSVRDEDWPEVRRRLKSVADFARGRALLQEALAGPAGEKRNQLLKDSEASLLNARRSNSADMEITYTLGLAQLSSGKSVEATSNFAAVYRGGGELAAKALANLRATHQLLDPHSTVSFESFLQQASDHSSSELEDSEGAAKESSSPPQRIQPAYFGSESCRGCHAEIYQRWSQTGMSKMFRPYAPQNVVGDFAVDNQFYLGDETDYRDGRLKINLGRDRTLFARMVIRNGRRYFDIRQSDGKWHSYPVDYTIGSKFEQAYATRLPNGEIHVFPIQYNVLQKRWINFWKIIDGPGSERADPRTWERLDGSTSYQAICAVCHTSQLKNAKGGGFDVNNVEFKEPGIDCEMCHGPSAEHVVEASANEYHSKLPQEPPVNFHKIDNRRFVAICGQCHMQSATRNPGPGGELNYSTTGDFFGSPLRAPFGEFSRKGFYKDGRFRQTTFMVEALERSRCFKKAEVSCGTCHDPHAQDSASNLTSLKFREQPDLMCTGCHTQFSGAAATTRHSHHSYGSEGSHCVSCHMPRIMDALLFRARYHQIDDIPNPEMTRRFGQQESPNACLLCHSEKNADWVEQQLLAWKTLSASRP